MVLKYTGNIMPAITLKKSPVLFLKNIGIIPLAKGIRTDGMAVGGARETKRPIPLKYRMAYSVPWVV